MIDGTCRNIDAVLPDLGWGYDAGLGVARLEPRERPIQADPATEYVSRPIGLGPDLLGPTASSLTRWHGSQVYRAMYETPACGSSFDALRAAVLANGVNLLPAVKPRLGAARPGQVDGSAEEAEMAAEIAASNRRLLERWETPVPALLWEMMEAMYLGHVLGEVVAEDVIGGPDDGLLAIKAVHPKPLGSYQFRVDAGGSVVGINAQTEKGWKLFPPEKFAWLTWDSYRNDPRGRSMFRKAHYHWDELMKLWPFAVKGWRQFGVPNLYGTTAPNAGDVPVRDASGQPVPGKTQSPERAMLTGLVHLQAGDALVGKNGSTVEVIESAKDGSVISNAVSLLEGQIVKSILLQMRATVEARNGSKADSETGQDVMGTIVRFCRMLDERFLRRLLRLQNAWNYGDEIARRLTPLVDLGGTEHQDFAANAAGVGVLFQAKYFTEAQLPEVDTMLGLPQRMAGDLRIGPDGEAAADDVTDSNDPAPVDPTTAPDAGQAPSTAPAEGVAA